jgi:hypothetical protein
MGSFASYIFLFKKDTVITPGSQQLPKDRTSSMSPGPNSKLETLMLRHQLENPGSTRVQKNVLMMDVGKSKSFLQFNGIRLPWLTYVNI